jgi:dTDP-4-dehydrorhamnose 3,5-epimerase-like enzyme
MEENSIKTINGAVATDDRGSVRFVNDFNFEGVKRFYQVQNHTQGFIRAWHAHKKEAKYVYVAKGSALVGAVSLEHIQDVKAGAVVDSSKVFKVIISSNNPKVVYIPAGYANGFKSLEDGTIIQFFSTSTLQDSLGDDIRFDYDVVNIWKEDYR